MAKTGRRFLFSVLFTLILGIMLSLGVLNGESAERTSENEPSVRLTALETVDIVVDQNTQYGLIYSSDSFQGDQSLAKELKSLITVSSSKFRPYPDTRAETEFEILIGNTNRAYSAELLAAIAELDDGATYIWAYAYKDGKLAYVANSDIAFSLGKSDFLSLVSEDGKLTVPSDLFVIGSMTYAEYEEILRAEEEEKKENYLQYIKDLNSEFDDSQFNTDKYTGGFYKPMIAEDGSGYFTTTSSGEPWLYPTEDQHPRYLITSSDIDRIKEILEEGKDESSVYYNMVQNFWRLADADEDKHLFGIFPEVKKNGEIHRHDGDILAIIEAKALAYLVTGNEIYAYEAIVCIKNAVLTLNYVAAMDPYHGASHVMVILAAVYDWCYDVMSENDKWQLIWGTAQILGPQMEAGYQYPPAGFTPVNGHGTGPQLLRDWMSVATVFSDEVPDWYRYVAGRYFNEFLPVANAQFQNGWVSQGTATYAPIKIYVHMWSAYLIKKSTGEVFLTEDAQQTMYFFMSHITPRETDLSYQQYYFQTGDGARNPGGTQVAWAEYMITAAMYNDPVLYAQVKDITNNFALYNSDTIYTLGPAFQLCFSAAVDYNGEGARDGVETIQYFGYPAGQMTARAEWGNSDSPAALMRLMNLTMGNHEGQDHGTFQIYYKGLLAATSGKYNKYGSDAHYYYQQATLSSNGLLIFNPANADAEPVYSGTTITNVARYYYSGSQRRASVGTSDVNAWLNSESTMTETTGAAWGYNNDGSSKYAYLGGDLTLAYDSKTVDYVGRKMFTLFTGDEDFPMLFFTFDQIASDDEDFTKHWLLHTIKEPTIDQDKLTATVINGDGKMYLQNLYGADAIVKIGGTGYAWWINGYFADPDNRGSWDVKTQSFTDPENIGSWVEGKNAIDDYANNDDAENIWGRIELRTEGEKFSRFFNVMAVTDTENDAVFEIEKFVNETQTVFGAQYGQSIIAFLSDAEKPAEKRYKEFSFTTEGKGLYEYYIAGLEAGTWNVKVDGVSVAYSLSEEDGELITFTAPAGEVMVTPGSDVIGANGGKINYVTGGGILPYDTLYVYKSETDFPLPTSLTRGDDIFAGWYTSRTYEPETKVEAIPAGTTGTYTVYAKWISTFVNEDYTKAAINTQQNAQTVNGILYHGKSKPGSSFITKTDENGVYYLEWLEGSADPLISMSSTSKNFSMLGSDDKCVSFTLKLRLNEGNTPMKTNFRLIAKQDVTGAAISSVSTYIFTTDTKGNVLTHKDNPYVTLSTDKVTELRIVVDFKNGEMRYYDEDYNVKFTDKFTAPESTKATNTEEYIRCLTEYLWYFYAGTESTITDAALRMYGIKVEEGDKFTELLKPQTEGIKYNGNGVSIPYDYIKDFNEDGSITILPTGDDLSLDGYVFDGWYTTPTFDEGTRTTYVPAGYEGLYEIWAKWNKIFINEDYSEVDIDHGESNKGYNGLSYNASGKANSSYKTENSADGRYLVFTPGEKDPLIVATNTTSNISTMADNSISYTITVGKHGDAPIPSFEYRLIGKHTVDGSSGTSDSNIYIAKLNSNGEFTLGSSSTIIATMGEKETTVRIVLNFESGKIEAYDEWGAIIASVSMPSIPAASGATTYLEWKNCFRNYLFYCRRTGGSADKIDEAIRIYGIRIEEGNAFELTGDEEPPKPNSIIYETDGGTLPEDAPTEYDVSLGTLLPTNVTKEGYIFGGWYTNEKLTERIDYIPYGTENPVKLYAKWLYVPFTEDWEDKEDFTHPESTSKNYDGIILNTGSASSPKAGTGFQSVKDETGNIYLKFFSPGASVFVVVNNRGQYQFPEFKESAVTFEFDYGRDGDNALANDELRFETSGSKYGKYVFLTINGATGTATLKGSSAPFATIGDEMVKFRITVDFAAETLTAYGENGEILDRVSLGSVPTSASGETQPATWAEWQRLATGYYVYHTLTKPTGFVEADGALYGLRFDNFKVIDGMPYIVFDTKLPTSNSIKYELSDGVLPEGAPTEYDPSVETELPIPEKDGFIFAGWYTSESFDEATRVEKIAAGTEGMLVLYAKWNYVFVEEDFESNTTWSAEKNSSYNDVRFNLQKEGSTAKVETDEQGNSYVSITATASDAIMMVTNSTYNLTHMTDTKLSMVLDLIAPTTGNLSNLNINIATSSSAYGQLTLATMSGNDGLMRLVGGTKVIADLSEGRVTLRLLVDFAEGIVYAYDADGKLIDSVKPSVPSGKQGSPATLAEWQKVAQNYLFYGYMKNPDAATSGSTSSLGFDNVNIVEGVAFYIAPEEESTECTEHSDADTDGMCDSCGTQI